MFAGQHLFVACFFLVDGMAGDDFYFPPLAEGEGPPPRRIWVVENGQCGYVPPDLSLSVSLLSGRTVPIAARRANSVYDVLRKSSVALLVPEDELSQVTKATAPDKGSDLLSDLGSQSGDYLMRIRSMLLGGAVLRGGCCRRRSMKRQRTR